MKLKLNLVFLALIFLLGLFLRLYKLDQSPPSLNWDETAAAYNAYSIWHWGKDEWGKTMPLVFTSFRDDKHPVHIYLTAPFVGIFGPTDVNARLSSVIISSLSIIVIYFLTRKIFKDEKTGIVSALFLALSPYHLFFSRGLWEIDFALFFFLLGLWLFFVGLEKAKYLIFSFLAFGISLYAYHSSKIVVLPIVMLLLVLYFKKLIRHKKSFVLSLIVFFVFIAGFVIEPKLLGLARVNQTRFSERELKSTFLYEKTNNLSLASVEIALKHYPQYFSYDYLFVKGDQNPRNSVKVYGEFYKTDIVFLLAGVIALLLLRSKITLLIFTWLLLAPFPSAISSATPNATRAMYMLGIGQIIAAFGATSIIKLIKNKIIVNIGIAVVLVITAAQFVPYYKYLLIEYPKREAIEWQYGMKDIAYYIRDNPNYTKVFMDNVRSQPYIFFLYYLGIPQPELAKSVKYDATIENTHNTIESFDIYQFGNWDWVHSALIDNYLYILEPSKYSGLSNREDFIVKKLIKYPNGSDAFYIVSSY